MMLINWKRFVVSLLPVKLRTGSVYGLISAMVSGVVHIYNTLLSYNSNVTYKLAHTSQVWSIEDALNDTFDPQLRRIYIADAGGNVIIPLQRDSDLDPYILGSDTEGTIMILQPDSGYTGGDYDFIVMLPYAFAQADIYRLKSIVDYYKLAGKRYDILVA